MKSVLPLACGFAICFSLLGCSQCQTKHYDPTTGLVYDAGFSKADGGSGGILGFLRKDKKKDRIEQAAHVPFGYQTAANCQCHMPHNQQWNAAGPAMYRPVSHQNYNASTFHHAGYTNGNCASWGTAPKVSSCGTCGNVPTGCGKCGQPATCSTCGAGTTINPQPANGCGSCAAGTVGDIVSGEFPIEVYDGAIEGELINTEIQPAPPAESGEDSQQGKVDDRAPLPEKSTDAGKEIEQLKWIPRRL